MKKSIKKLIILGICFFCVALSPIISNCLDVGIRDTSLEYWDNPNSDHENLKLSKVSGKIHINNNWSAAKTALICTGNGIYSDPYVIEDLVIDANFTGSCILIENSNVYFKIENCTVFNAVKNDAGIKLENTTRGSVSGNNVSNNDYGISLIDSDNNTFSGNNVINNNWGNTLIGISLINSDNNTFSGNNVIHNDPGIGPIGISLSNSDNNIFSGNNIDNDGYGMGIQLMNCTNIKISGNTIYTSAAINFILVNNSQLINNDCLSISRGIILYECDNNIVSGNTASNKLWGGIELSDSDNNIVSGNTVNTNLDNGIFLETNCNNNTISGNIANFNKYGIFLETNCNNNTISGNIANNNNHDGIYLDSSNNNNFSGNTVNSNDAGGIYLINSDNNTFSGNAASFNTNDGINLKTSNDNTLSGNTANHNDNNGIHLESSDDNAIMGNNLLDNDLGICLDNSDRIEMSGNIIDLYALQLFGNLQMLASHDIDATNLVDGKPVYYYANEVNLGASDFTNAGQVILVNCNDSSISNLNIANGPTGISLYYCNANNISGNDVSSNKYNGISLYYSDDNAISGNTVNSNIDVGIYLDSSNNNTVSGNLFTGNGFCINETNCVGNEFSNNGDCLYGIVLPGDDIPGYNLYILIGIISVLLVLSIRIMKKRKTELSKIK